VAFGPTSKEKPNTHSTFESIASDGKGGVLLGGVANNIEGVEFKYKSAGNVPQGDAFAWRISAAGVNKGKGPTQKDITWSYNSNKWTSIKAIRVDTKGNAIGALHRERNSRMDAGLVSMAFKNGKALWGPKYYPQQTEATDMAVAPDGSGFVVTGHGSTEPRHKNARYLGRLTRVDAKGKYLWTQTIAYDRKHTDAIYNECWGVQPDGFDKKRNGWILSCGTGVENKEICHYKGLSVKKKACLAGLPKLWGGKKRNPSAWSNMVPRFKDSTKSGKPGKLMWSSVTSYSESPSGSSAAEFISPCKKGGYYVTTDENFGVGILKLGGPKPKPPKPPCKNKKGADEVIENFSKGTISGCKAARHLCHHSQYGAHVRSLCKKTCGLCEAESVDAREHS